MLLKAVIKDERLKGYLDRIFIGLKGDDGLFHGISMLEYRYLGFEMNDEVWGGHLSATDDGLAYLKKRVAARIQNYIYATDKVLAELGYVSIDGVPIDPKKIDIGTLGEDNHLQ